MTHDTQPHSAPHAPKQTQPSVQSSSDGLAIASMVLGIVSIITFTGLLTGIPAIILGIVALKKKAGEKSFSIVGIVTGAVSSFISLLLIGLIILFALIGATESEQDYDSRNYDDYRYESSRSSEL